VLFYTRTASNVKRITNLEKLPVGKP
jgi:hypothetical protein